MTELEKQLLGALEALVAIADNGCADAWRGEWDEARSAIAAAEAGRSQTVDSECAAELREALNIANYLWRNFYAAEAPHWQPLDTVRGLLTQIDNMVAGIHQPATPPNQPVAVPDDYALVPKEPTQEQKSNGMFAWDDAMKKAKHANKRSVSWFDMMGVVYCAMLAAAPKPEGGE